MKGKGVFNATVFAINGCIIPEDELERAARTLVGKPVMVDFDSSKVVGIITDANFTKGLVEYEFEADVPQDAKTYPLATFLGVEDGNKLRGVTFTGVSYNPDLLEQVMDRKAERDRKEQEEQIRIDAEEEAKRQAEIAPFIGAVIQEIKQTPGETVVYTSVGKIVFWGTIGEVKLEQHQ